MTALARLGAVPAAAVAGWLLVAVPLLALGAFRPLPVVLLAVPAGVLAGVGAWHASASARTPAEPAWPAAACFALAGAFAALSALMRSEHVLVRRDPGTYAQSAWWLAEHGSLPVPGRLAEVGGAGSALTLDSPGFFEVGDAVVPQFLHGLPLVMAAARWLAGWPGLLGVNAVVGALALLAAAGLVGRLVGTAWAPLATAALGLSQPVLHAARAPYSEPLAQLLLLGGLCLLVDAIRAGRQPPARRAGLLAGLLAGLVLGSMLVVRVDASRDLLPLIPVAGWLWVRRAPAAGPLAAGLAVGAAAGALDGLALSRPYLETLRDPLVPVVFAAAVAVLLTVPVAAVLRSPRGRAARAVAAAATRRLSAAGPVLVVAVFLLLLSRPLWYEARQDPQSPYGRFVAGIQYRAGMPVDGGRLYFEHSLSWLAWYAGWAAVVLAVAAAAVLTGRVLARTADPAAVPVLLVVLFATVTTLWRPGITPDHPWADRRFVPAVLPGVVLLATWALAAVVRRVRQRWPRHPAGGPSISALVAAAGGAALVGPALVASWPVLAVATERGQVAAVHQACASFGARDVALLVDARARNEWAQPLRAQCGVPTAALRTVTREEVRRVAQEAQRRGRQVVLVAAEAPPAVTPTGGLAFRAVVHLRTREDVRVLTERPRGTAPLEVRLWVARLPGA